MTPNPVNIEAWCRALESGRYPQARLAHQVLDENGNLQGYDPIGVACELAAESGIGCWKESVETKLANENRWLTYIRFGPYETETESIYDDGLPLPVRAWLGIDENMPWFEIDGKNQALVDLNDSGNWSFDGLAKLIRGKYLGATTQTT